MFSARTLIHRHLNLSVQASLATLPGGSCPAPGSSALHKALLTQLVGLR